MTSLYYKNMKLGLISKAGFVALLVILVIVMVGSSVAWSIYKQTQSEVEQRLESTLNSSLNHVKQTLHEYKTITAYWADEASILRIAHALNAPTAMFLKRKTKNSLNKILAATLKEHDFRDFKLINHRGRVLTSKSGHDVGSYLEWTEVMSTAWDGGAQVSLPFTSSRIWTDFNGLIMNNTPSMFVMAPVKDSRDRTVALLVFEFDPDKVFTPVFHHNQLGITGQTYGLNKQGLLLTHVKHTDALYALNILDKSIKHPELNLYLNQIAVSDDSQPTQVLTFMANEIKKGRSGCNVDGYLDYRGVEVVGAWLWDDDLNMGFATETEFDDAYMMFSKVKTSIIYGVVGLSLVIFFSIIIYIRTARLVLRSHQQRDAIINNAAEGIFTIDINGIITMANPQSLVMFGYADDEILGRPIVSLVKGDGNYLLSNLTSSSESFLPERLDGQRKDGSIFPLELFISKMSVDDDIYFLGLARDITEREKQKQDLVNTRDEAEKAKERAESANRAKSQFLSKMSHELRTPLNAILGFSQLLLMDKMTSDQTESVEMISSSGQHLLNLINDILDVSQIESGNMTVTLEQVDLLALINEIKPLIETQLSVFNLSFSIEASDEDIFTVKADRLKLKQVILNLLSNAVKYNRQNGYISVVVSRHDANKIQLAIQDAGEGLSEQEIASLFEPFNRLGREHSDVEGTGIGLVISRELLKLMEGNILVDSKKGYGSTFTIELPSSVNTEQVDLDDSTTSIADSRLLEQQAVPIVDVLYIEDNPANMALVRQLIARYPEYAFYEATSAEQGLDIIRAQNIDIVLMDINLPGMNGFDALDVLIDEGLSDGLTVIGVSANALLSEVQRGHDAGFDYYLTKPINFRELTESLNEISVKIGKSASSE